MRHTNIGNHLFVLFLFLCLGVFIAYLVTAQTQPDPTTITLHNGTRAEIEDFDNAKYWELKTSSWLGDRNGEMEHLERGLTVLKYGLDDAYDTPLCQPFICPDAD